ncbi:MAG: SH3 domain-containing protein, partial [Candidatus Roseilinea sp.]|uniref:SH3 domain-containing protein n=1 Tax=Candidatus Roseilinea sp. TaxID=2838777 RepID=UPI0040498425
KTNPHLQPSVAHLPRMLLALTLLVTMLAACGAAAPPAQAVLSEPSQQAQLMVGVATNIVGQVIGEDVRVVDVYIDGVKYATIDAPTAENQFDLIVPWTPPIEGTHVIQLKGANDKGEEVVASDLVFVMAKAPPPAITPTPEATPAPPTPEPPAPTPEQPTATPVPSLVKVTNDFVNVRTGPGTGYERVGQLNLGQIVPVVAKNEDGTWWQIEFQGGPDGKAWVIGQYVEFSGDANAVPVVKVAPPAAVSTSAAPAATAVPAATATSELPPSALLPYSQSMRFSPRDDIGDVPLGHDGPKSSTLVWEINGAKKLELEITVKPGPGTYSACQPGNLNSIQAAGFTPGQRVPLSVPSGSFPFTIEDSGYYEFTIHVVKTDNSLTTIPRAVIVGCYKQS